jgi:predicted transcriptional regulator
LNSTCYDPSLDDEIFKIIDQKNETTFTEIFKKLQQDGLINSRTTLSQHLKFLNKKKIIKWNRNPNVRKGSIKYRPIIEKQRQYGLLKVDYTDKTRWICKKWKEQNQENIDKDRENKKILYLLLSAAYGSLDFKTSTIPKPGDVVIRDSKGASKTVSISKEEGFSPFDLDKNESQFSIMRDYFKYDYFSKNEIEQIIKDLSKDISLRPLLGIDGKNTRYDIEDENLKNLLIWCTNILKGYVLLMQMFWFVTNTLPTKERNWFRLIVGPSKAADFFTEIEENKRIKRSIKDLYTEVFYDGIDRDLVNKIIKEKEDSNPNYFTKNELKKRMFNSSSSEFILQIKIDCQTIATDKKIQTLIKSKKYEWLIEKLPEIINPEFSRSLFQVKLN